MVELRGIEPLDLLDANESTWAFARLGSVGCNRKPKVTALKKLKQRGGWRSYCGLTVDQVRLASCSVDSGGERAFGGERRGLKRQGAGAIPWTTGRRRRG
jgi:hypothetical protein